MNEQVCILTEKEIKETRQVLGKKGEIPTDEEIRQYITQTDHLLEAWMEAYEKQIYNGKTFNEIFCIKKI